jgi:pantetheine-phosphate adenylyltransferase
MRGNRGPPRLRRGGPNVRGFGGHVGAPIKMGKRAVYTGMFDPLHNGHLDVIQRSLQIFDEVIVAVGANPSKTALFTVEERLEMIDEATANLGLGANFRIVSFEGLVIDLVTRERANCIVRGIRAVSDFEYEFAMALMNRKLRPTVETVFLMPHEKYTYISSRLIKEVASFGTSVAGMVPPIVEKRLTEKFPPR